MHLRAARDGVLVNLDNLTPGKQQAWLDQQPQPKTKEQSRQIKRVKRLIELSKDEESE